MNNQTLTKINNLLRDIKRTDSSIKRQEMIVQVLELMVKLQ
jgi:hypothetical protein